MNEVELEYLLPAADLQPFLGLFYHFRSPGAVFDDIERAGAAQLRFRLSPSAGRYHFCDGSVHEAAAFHLIGPTTGAMRVQVDGPVWVFGVGLSPLGWAALLACEASDHCNACVDAKSLIGDLEAETGVALNACATAAEMVAAIEPVLRRRLGEAHGATVDFVRSVDGWLAGAHSPALDVLVAATGLSRRQVERRCNALYGAPPKMLARKFRALRAAVAMAAGEEAPVDGFYDQSHMIREVKHFTGLTPGRMREGPGPLAQRTIAQRRAFGAKVSPLVRGT